MRTHIGVVTWNRLALTRLCLESLLAKTPPGYGLTVVDNASNDGTREYLYTLAQSHPHMRIRFLERNMGVAVASNLSWDDAADADYFVKLDNDVEILDPYWLNRLTDVMTSNPTIGPAGYQLCPWHKGHPLILANGNTVLAVPCCNGACCCIPAALHEKLGFWNEGYGRYGYEDLEYSWRALRAGYTPIYAIAPDAVRHHGAEPARLDLKQESIKKTSRTASLSGTKAYLLYLLLFDKGILPLKMERKYLPVEGLKGVSFAFNPAHKAVQRLLLNLVNTVDITSEGELSRLDLRAWRDHNTHFEETAYNE